MKLTALPLAAAKAEAAAGTNSEFYQLADVPSADEKAVVKQVHTTRRADGDMVRSEPSSLPALRKGRCPPPRR
jgi:hypothetical protein